jgi:hypothetical protein
MMSLIDLYLNDELWWDKEWLRMDLQIITVGRKIGGELWIIL